MTKVSIEIRNSWWHFIETLQNVQIISKCQTQTKSLSIWNISICKPSLYLEAIIDCNSIFLWVIPFILRLEPILYSVESWIYLFFSSWRNSFLLVMNIYGYMLPKITKYLKFEILDFKDHFRLQENNRDLLEGCKLYQFSEHIQNVGELTSLAS